MKLLEGGKSMRKPEILAPAGNLEELKILVQMPYTLVEIN
mgnify:CR=1 FL=1